ncbi:MAG: hypothetical protein R3A51_17700 [Nannocystaceae bacterium]|nr:hypothetical protein [Myxococcales bacterium]
MNYAPLAALRIVHPYYPLGRCPEVDVAPTPAGARALAGHRLLLRPTFDGAIVLAPLDERGAPLIAYAAGLSIDLELRPRSSALAACTDLSELAALAAPRFTNADAPSGALTLADGPGPRARGALAEVSLTGVSAAWLTSGPATFDVPLAPRRARWVYYFVTDIPDPTITLVDQASAPIRFGAGAELDVELDARDSRARELAGRYPGARRIRFISDELVPCREAPLRTLELRAADQRLNITVPPPSLESSSLLEDTLEPIPQRRAALFHVVKHLTHASPTNG